MPCPVITEPASRYDLILINHTTCAAQAQFWKLEGTKVYTSHGPGHPLERPGIGADYYVGVSEEIQQVMAEQQMCRECGNIQVPRSLDVIRQPIDLEKFKPREGGGGKYLIMPKRTDAMEAMARKCQEMGLDFDIVHYKANPVEDMWNVYPKYRAVITAGRGALEAMACGCQVFIYNGQSDGWATPGNARFLAQANYSGRYDGRVPLDTLRDVPRYDMRPWVMENHDMHTIADRYLLYAEA